MKCPLLRSGRRRLIALAVVVLLAPVAWVAFLLVVPTDCARLKIADCLGRSIGRKVTIGRLSVGPLGGLTIGDLTVRVVAGEPSPWLRVDKATMNLGLGQLLFGHVDPTSIEVNGLYLRVLRRHDGSLELADGLRPPSTSGNSDNDEVEAQERNGLDVKVRGATIRFIDKSIGTDLEITGIDGSVTLKGRQATIRELHGSVHGGTIELAAEVDRAEGPARFEGQLRLRDVALGSGMNALAYLSPVLAGAKRGLDGRLRLDLYLRGQGESRETIRQTLVGQGRIVLDPVALDGSRILAGIADLFDLPPRGRVGDVWADLRVKDGRVITQNLTVDVAKIPVVLEGWTDFDGRIDYRLHAESFLEKLPAKAQDVLNQLRPRLRIDDLGDIRIGGTVDDLVITSRGVPVSHAGDKRRGQDVSRKGRDILRR